MFKKKDRDHEERKQRALEKLLDSIVTTIDDIGEGTMRIGMETEVHHDILELLVDHLGLEIQINNEQEVQLVPQGKIKKAKKAKK